MAARAHKHRNGAFNHRTHGDMLMAASLYLVPGRAGTNQDKRLPTEQFAALKERHRIVCMRERKAVGNEPKLAKLKAVRLNIEADMQRVSDMIVKQWARDDKFLSSSRNG